MSLCKDYKQILRRQYSFVHITTPQVALGQALHTHCGFRVPGNGPSPLSHKQPYLSVCLLVRNFHIFRPLSCAPEGVVIIQKNNNNNSCTSIVLLYLLCRWGSWGQRGLISLLSNKEEGEASPEPMSFESQMALSLTSCLVVSFQINKLEFILTPSLLFFHPDQLPAWHFFLQYISWRHGFALPTQPPH